MKHFILAAIFLMNSTLGFAQETGPAGSVMRVPPGGGRARMGPIDLSSIQATTGFLGISKINGTTAGSCIFGAASGGGITQASSSDCVWNSTGSILGVLGGINIGTTTSQASAALQVASITKGFLPPRMSTAQRDAISSPATGLQIYNTSTNQVNMYNGSAWVGIGSGGGGDGGINLLEVQNFNPDYENGYNGSWTNSGGAWAAATGSDILFGLQSLVFTASGASQYVRSSLVTVTYGLANQPCIGQVYYKGGDANLTLKVLDSGGTLMGSRAFVASTDRAVLAVPFVCGAQGSQYRLSIESTAAAAKVALDRTKLGEYGFGTFTDAVPTSISQIISGSGTFNVSSNTRYIKVKIVGGGAGGAGSGSASIGAGGAGGATTFGTLTANGGASTVGGNQPGGAGGTFTIGSGWAGVGITGSQGNTPTSYAPSAGVAYSTGGQGGNAPYFAGAGVGHITSNGVAAAANSGSGGGGAGNNAIALSAPGAGGASGAFIDAYTTSLASSYAYSIGSGGAGGTPGTSGLSGGAGGTGRIIIEEYGYASGMTLTPASGGLSPGDFVTGAWAACPAGTIWADGSSLTTATYPQLFAAIGYTYGGSGGNYTLPDRRGVFAKGAGTQTIAGIVYVGTQGTAQADQFQGHYHGLTFQSASAGPSVNNISVMLGSNTATPQYMNQTGNVNLASSIVTDGSNGTPRFADQTRPANIVERVCIRTVPGAAMPVMVGPYAQMPAATTTGTTYTILSSDEIVDIDTTANAVTVTMPTAVGQRGKKITVAKVSTSANLVTIQTVLSQTIGGNLTTKLHQRGESVELFSDGANWQFASPEKRTETLQVTAVCNTNPCTGVIQNGAWATNVSRSGTGTYQVNVVSGIFSANPICTVTAMNSNTYFAYNYSVNSTSQVFVATSNTALALVDGTFTLSCTGTR